MLTKQDVLVIVPAFNEQESISQVISDISKCGYKYVVIDDSSEDETRKRVLEVSGEVLTLPINGGVGAALRCGFKYAIQNGYKAVIQCDADGQHPPDHFDRLLSSLNESKSDLVIGSRFESTETTMKPTMLRKIAMKTLSKIASRYTGCEISDATSGFRIISSPLLNEFADSFPTYYLGDTFEALVVAGSAGYKVTQIPTPIAPRMSGESTSSTSESIVQIVKVLLVTLFGLHFRISRAN